MTINCNPPTLKIIRLLRFINRRFIREAERHTQREKERTFESFVPLVSVDYISKVLNIRRERERFALSRLEFPFIHSPRARLFLRRILIDADVVHAAVVLRRPNEYDDEFFKKICQQWRRVFTPLLYRRRIRHSVQYIRGIAEVRPLADENIERRVEPVAPRILRQHDLVHENRR